MWTDLKDYVGAGASDDEFIQRCHTEAEVLVTDYVGAATVPVEIIDRAVLEVGSELYHRRNAPSGIAQYASLDGAQPLRVARDPMIAAYPILSRYMVVGI